ncbi:hypothetical protein AeRB84_012395 [Aphanomyces euteiches]|nr:hypothetical protein AeRB84_012395 [Aphanomyces euteiches]
MGTGRRDLTSEERDAILREVLLESKNGYMARLPKGFSQVLASKYGCHQSTIRKVLARAKQQGVADGNMRVSVLNRKRGRVGRKKAFTAEQVKEKILRVPIADRTNLRLIAEKTGISRGTLHRYLKQGIFRVHTNAIKPILTEANKYMRMRFALGFVKSNLELRDMHEYVHLDEKWFYLTRETKTFYLVPGERGPERKCKSKRFITKVMFLSAVARPRYIEDTGLWWDGKVGTWPFVQEVPAKRSSANRPAGSIGLKTLTVTKELYHSYLIDKILPSIVAKWPTSERNILLQHDNARSHVSINEDELTNAFNSYKPSGWNFCLAPQPPNSPDTNILDLGFFAALQSLQHRKRAHSIQGLIDNVLCAYDKYPYERLNHTFITLQSCLLEMLKCFGDNTYKIPHL